MRQKVVLIVLFFLKSLLFAYSRLSNKMKLATLVSFLASLSMNTSGARAASPTPTQSAFLFDMISRPGSGMH